MKASEIAKIAAEIAEQLDELKPDDAEKVLEVVETLRKKPAPTKKTAAPNFAPPDEPPRRRDPFGIFQPSAPQLQTYH